MISGTRRPAMCTGVLVAIVVAAAGCADLNVPLGTESLQHQAKDPRVSIVLLHFKTRYLPSAPTGALASFAWFGLPLVFSVANESTGWSLRVLPGRGGVFSTGNDSIEPEPQNVEGGWVTFLAPPGPSYIAVTTLTTAFALGGQDLVAAPFADHISVRHSAGRSKLVGSMMLDFIDVPRFAVQLPATRSLIYAGTIIRTVNCAEEKPRFSMTCPYDLTVIDESEIAKAFVSRYRGNLSIEAQLRTQLLTIPQSRTIEIRTR